VTPGHARFLCRHAPQLPAGLTDAVHADDVIAAPELPETATFLIVITAVMDPAALRAKMDHGAVLGEKRNNSGIGNLVGIVHDGIRNDGKATAGDISEILSVRIPAAFPIEAHHAGSGGQLLNASRSIASATGGVAGTQG